MKLSNSEYIVGGVWEEKYLEPSWFLIVLQQPWPKLHIDLVQTEFHITLQHPVSAALETKGKLTHTTSSHYSVLVHL